MTEPLNDEDLEKLADKLLAKMLSRLARRASNAPIEEPPPRKPPSPEALADVQALRRRRGGRRR